MGLLCLGFCVCGSNVNKFVQKIQQVQHYLSVCYEMNVGYRIFFVLDAFKSSEFESGSIAN